MSNGSAQISDSDVPPIPGSIPSEMFPILTAAQQSRVLAHGKRRSAGQNEIVVELNELVTKVFLVVNGRLHALKVSDKTEQVVAVCNPGMFTGELTVLTGRRGLVRIRATENSDLIERQSLQRVLPNRWICLPAKRPTR
jgi:CRP-like cAMP-binding protein